MGALILPSRFTQQPQVATQIDGGSSLSTKLVYCVDHTGLDLVSRNSVALPLVATPAGLTASLQSNDINVYASPALALGSEWTIAYSFTPTTLSGGFDLFVERNAKADGNHFEIYKDASSATLSVYIVNGGGGVGGGAALVAGKRVDAVITASAGVLRLYLSGILAASSAWTGSLSGATNWLRFNPTEGGTAQGRQSMLFFRAWSRALLPQELAAHNQNPWQIFKAPLRRLWVQAPTVASTALAGAASAQASASGALSTAVQLAGLATASASASGALTTAVRLSGASVAQAAAGGALATQITLAGAAAASASASGALAGGAAQLSGAAVASASASASGALTTGIRLTGTATAQASASGSLGAAGAALSGAAVATASASGALLTTIRLAGLASASASASGSLAGSAVVLSGAAVASASAGGALVTSIALAGTAQAVAAGSGSLTTSIRLTGSTTAAASASGQLWIGQRIDYARAPAGSGYTPHRNESDYRPASAATARPANTQRNDR